VLTDGSCVDVRYSDGLYNGIQATSYDASGIVYHFYDQTGDFAAYVRLERDQGTTGWYLSTGYRLEDRYHIRSGNVPRLQSTGEDSS